MRLKAIEATDQARKDQQDRADKLEKIVEEQSTELDVRLKAIEATDQARKDQQDRADTLEKVLAKKELELNQLRAEVADLLSEEIRSLQDPEGKEG